MATKRDKANQSPGLFQQGQSFFEKNNTLREFELKVQEFNALLENELENGLENEPHSKNITKIMNALIALNTVIELINNQPYQEWCMEAQKTLFSIDDTRAKKLAREIIDSLTTSKTQPDSQKTNIAKNR